MALALHVAPRTHCPGIPSSFSSSVAHFSRVRRWIGFEVSPGRVSRRGLKVCCESGVLAAAVEKEKEKVRQVDDGVATQLSIVMKFGGSSVASSDRMREVADLVLSYPEERPVIVLSAMGKTTNNLLMAGEHAVCCGVKRVSELQELTRIKELHLKTVVELGVDRSIVTVLLDELEDLLKGIARMKELTLRTTDYLVSFGECMSTRIFAAYLNKIGAKARQGIKLLMKPKLPSLQILVEDQSSVESDHSQLDDPQRIDSQQRTTSSKRSLSGTRGSSAPFAVE